MSGPSQGRNANAGESSGDDPPAMGGCVCYFASPGRLTPSVFTSCQLLLGACATGKAAVPRRRRAMTAMASSPAPIRA